MYVGLNQISISNGLKQATRGASIQSKFLIVDTYLVNCEHIGPTENIFEFFLIVGIVGE